MLPCNALGNRRSKYLILIFIRKEETKKELIELKPILELRYLNFKVK